MGGQNEEFSRKKVLASWFPAWKHILAILATIAFLALDYWYVRGAFGPRDFWANEWDRLWAGGWPVVILLVYIGQWGAATGWWLGRIAAVPISRHFWEIQYAAYQAQVAAGTAGEHSTGPWQYFIWLECVGVAIVIGAAVQLAVWFFRKYLPGREARAQAARYAP